jgi:hypothetical protein
VTGPTFVAQFADGEVTRMTCHCTPQRLDPAQGMRMSRGAYQTRARNRRRTSLRKTHDPLIDGPWPCDDDPVLVPEIVAARFEDLSGTVLAEYSSEQLTEIGEGKP